ncbi:serine hydrolase [Brevibacillus sp. FSL K6-0770]|jgi:CubicO group peptidase (beta-lactamase class C family)|uniref:serine hydrolase domain-containing protein n=1 Tax=Brevibacillus TaxID=55080 RepID=UPI000ED0406E|nr:MULTISPECIES: serine hydrolase [Brevibacillus]MDR5000350.1 serine hydrolase [Brevibacillus parabrevis]HBZ80981.1 penicillin-binding protein [Brevibacillus sp.]
MKAIETLLQSWIDEKLLPGAALRIVREGRTCFSLDVGATSVACGQPITKDTLFDLASLTKVTATLPAVLLLMQDGKLAADERIGAFFADCPADKAEITIGQLLTHTSGLPADLEVRTRNSDIDLPGLLYRQPLLYKPGEQVVYSDLGMIWLGLLIEKLAEKPLDEFVTQRVFAPLKMERTCFRPSARCFPNIAQTEYCSLTDAYICGEVHDEKAFAMGGVAGHAGLFSTADDLCLYAKSWLYADPPLLAKQWRDEAVRNHTAHANGSRGYGWELNQTGTLLSCGQNFHSTSYGHTGFTGTSIWLDPVRELAVIFLTNAVHLGRNHQLRQLRPILHDAVTTALQTV